MEVDFIDSRATWEVLLPDRACALQQSWTYGAAVEAMGGRAVRAVVSDRGRPLALAQIILRRVGPVAGLGLLGRGPIWLAAPDRRVLPALRRALPGSWLRLLVATPEQEERGMMPLYTSCCMAEIGLDPDLDAMRRRMHQKWRNRLVRAESAGLTVTVTRGPAPLMRLLAREDVQRRSRRYRGLPARFVANWVREDPAGYVIYRASMGAEPVAEMLFLDHAPGVTYQVGWTGGAGRCLSAHHLLLWRAMADFAGSGRARMDLGLLDTVTTPGLARFKLGCGATARVLGRTGLVLPGWPSRAAGYSGSISTGTVR